MIPASEACKTVLSITAEKFESNEHQAGHHGVEGTTSLLGTGHEG